jgi:hypothetical protein
MTEPVHVTLVERTGRTPRGFRVDRVLGSVSHADLARLYGESHVVLKLSRVEGMYGPPLEGFHMGATTVTTAVTGHEEYVEHGWNGLVVDWDDPHGTARQLDLLAQDRRLLHFLRTNALATAASWPSWQQAGTFMAAALSAIRRAPATEASGVTQLLADARVALELQRRQADERHRLNRLARPARAVKRVPGVERALRVRHALRQRARS